MMETKGRHGRKNLNRSTESSKPRASLNPQKVRVKKTKQNPANSSPTWSWGSGVRDKKWENQVGSKQGAIVLEMA